MKIECWSKITQISLDALSVFVAMEIVENSSKSVKSAKSVKSVAKEIIWRLNGYKINNNR